MLSTNASSEALVTLFADKSVVDLPALLAALQTTSRMSVFRRLSAMEYLSSCSHAGRYYTLKSIPTFDADGLWQYQGILFSSHGSLKETTWHLVDISPAGQTHQELRDRLRLRLHNTLLDLIREERIQREAIADVYVYLSVDHARAEAQRAKRQQEAPILTELVPSVVIAILMEVIHGARVVPDATIVAARLRARGLPVEVRWVEAVYARHGLEKKAARSHSKRSRP